jgi:exopolysaccharide production protein ExoQ
MPPIVAFILTLAFVVWMFRRDFRERPNVTRALWIPTLWLFLICSRTVTQWLDLVGISMGGSYEDGTPADAVVFSLLIGAGVFVLYRRRVNVAEIVSHNRLLTFFLLYCLISIVWSDFPFVAFKRWIKILGHPIMTLVVFTEPDWEEAIIRLMKRCAYVIAPVSILFIKYFPDWSHENNPYGGPALLTGITLDKNMMGSVCFILSLFYFWYLLQTLRRERTVERRNELLLCLFFLGLFAWLLYSVHSSTSTVSLAVGIGVMLFLGSRNVDPRYIGTYFIIGCVVFGLANWLFGLFDMMIDLLGKDPTLTDRTKVWTLVLHVQNSPFLGSGFESFWLGDRRERIWDEFWWHPIQAHNGYLETYLSLGLVGVGLMLALIVSAFVKGRRSLLAGFDFGRFRLAFVTAFVLYNWTEAAFKATHPVWFVFYIVAIDYSLPGEQPIPETGLSMQPLDDRAGFEGEIVA